MKRSFINKFSISDQNLSRYSYTYDIITELEKDFLKTWKIQLNQKSGSMLNQDLLNRLILKSENIFKFLDGSLISKSAVSNLMEDLPHVPLYSKAGYCNNIFYMTVEDHKLKTFSIKLAHHLKTFNNYNELIILNHSIKEWITLNTYVDQPGQKEKLYAFVNTLDKIIEYKSSNFVYKSDSLSLAKHMKIKMDQHNYHSPAELILQWVDKSKVLRAKHHFHFTDIEIKLFYDIGKIKSLGNSWIKDRNSLSPEDLWELENNMMFKLMTTCQISNDQSEKYSLIELFKFMNINYLYNDEHYNAITKKIDSARASASGLGDGLMNKFNSDNRYVNKNSTFIKKSKSLFNLNISNIIKNKSRSPWPESEISPKRKD